MPRRSLSVCTQPGCAQLVATSRCAQHQRPRPPAPPRPTRQQLGYDEDWLRISAQIRRERPWCEHCHKRRSEHVDHIDGDRTNRARSNLQALCRSCHGKKTAQSDGGFGNPRRGRTTKQAPRRPRARRG